MRCLRSLITGLLALTVAPSTAGPWTQAQGRSYTKISTSYLRATSEFDHEGAQLDLFEEDPGFEAGAFRGLGLSFYGEIGLRDRLTLIGSLPLKALRAERTGLVGGGLLRQRSALNTVGLSDLSVSLRFGLTSGALVTAVQTGVRIPLGYDSRPDNDGPPLGTGEIDLEIHLLAGGSIAPRPVYVTADVGYRRRGGRLHDEVLFALEGGLRRGALAGRITLDGIRNTRRPADIYGGPIVTPLPGGGGVTPDLIVGDQHSLKLSPAISYDVRPGTSVQMELLHVVDGTSALAGTEWILGLIMTR